jgi:hypothetical protein
VQKGVSAVVEKPFPGLSEQLGAVRSHPSNPLKRNMIFLMRRYLSGGMGLAFPMPLEGDAQAHLQVPVCPSGVAGSFFVE